MSPNLMGDQDLLNFALEQAEKERLQSHIIAADLMLALASRLQSKADGPQGGMGLLTADDPEKDPLSLKSRLAKANKADELEKECTRLKGELHLAKGGRKHSDAECDDLIRQLAETKNQLDEQNKMMTALQEQRDKHEQECKDHTAVHAEMEDRALKTYKRIGHIGHKLNAIKERVKPQAVKAEVDALYDELIEARRLMHQGEVEAGGGNPPAEAYEPPTEAAGEVQEPKE